MKRTDLKTGDKVIVVQSPPSRRGIFAHEEKCPKGNYYEATVTDPKVTYKGYHQSRYGVVDIPAVEIEVTGAVGYHGDRTEPEAVSFSPYRFDRHSDEVRTAKFGERIKVKAATILMKADDHARELADRMARVAADEALLARCEAIGVKAKIEKFPHHGTQRVVVTESVEDLIERLEAAAKVTV